MNILAVSQKYRVSIVVLLIFLMMIWLMILGGINLNILLIIGSLESGIHKNAIVVAVDINMMRQLIIYHFNQSE